MLCEFCRENEATLHFKQVLNGDVREIDICPECAERSGFDIQSPMAMTDFLFGMGGAGKLRASASEKRCATCNMQLSDFRESSRLGCPNCYEAFAEQLQPMLREMHRGLNHCGKIPARQKAHMDLKVLRDELQKAVAEQDFERAAVLRDEIELLDNNESSLRAPAS